MKRTTVLFALFMMTATFSFAQTNGAIVFHQSGRRPYYTFNSTNYYRRPWNGYTSLVDAIQTKVPQDNQIQQLGLEYHRKTTVGETLMITGLATILGVAGYRVYQAIDPAVTPRLDVGPALVIDVSAVVVELVGYGWAGAPTRLVAYYNQHYPSAN